MISFKMALLAGLAGSALVVPSAFAQQVPASDHVSPEEREAAAGDILVTGSRIARPETESAMPVSVVRFDEATALGRVNAYDALRFEPSLSVGTSVYSSQHTDAEAGAAYLNLRNLGTNRSLTLIDGRRRVSGNVTASAVDINMIPTAMIDRIEIVTGGAAAIYGADAVTGAVNVVTKKAVEGFNLSAYQGISQEGDAPETSISLAAGGRFGDGRGSFSVGATYLKTGYVLHRDRSFTARNISTFANPANKGPKDGIPDNITLWDTFWNYNSDVPALYIPNNDTFYTYLNGQLSPLHYGTQVSTGEFSRGIGTSNPSAIRNYNEYYPLKLGQETFAAIARFDYELLDGVVYGAQFDYGRTVPSGQISRYREDSRTLFAAPHGGAVARLDNPYMPQSVRDLLTGFGRTSANIDRFYSNWPSIQVREDRQNLTLLQRLSGTIGNGFNWEAFYQYGRTTKDMTVPNVPRTSRWVAARDVIADPVTGRPVCRDVAARNAGCVPYNIFSNDPMTQAERDYILTTLYGRSTVEQTVTGANLDGQLFALPYGDIAFAAGIERRTEKAEMVADPQVISGDARPGGFEGVLPSSNIKGSMAVTELFGELVVPLLRDLPFARGLSVEGAYRYSDYRTIGSTDAWKVGLNWEPVAGLRFRGVRSRSVRAPNFGELYSPVSTGVTGSINDPCLVQNYNANPTRAANCAASGVTTPLAFYADNVEQRSGGNVNLNPETSDSVTAGVVFQPRFLSGLDITADYWDIRIKGIITNFTLQQMLDQCVDLPSLENPFCPNVRRGSNGRVTFVSTQRVNASEQGARGIDFGFNYRVPLGGGQLGLNFKGSYLIKRQIQTIPGVAAALIRYEGGYTDPKFRGYLVASYGSKHYNVALSTQFISASQLDPNVSDEYYEENSVPARVYNDISVSRNFGSELSLTLGVKNLFNVEPPRLPTVYSGGAGRYDTIGRYFFTSANIHF